MSIKKKKKIIIVGAGLAGLTAGAYILRSGYELLILEKTSDCGGLVSSFNINGFLFDTGVSIAILTGRIAAGAIHKKARSL